MTLVPNRPQQLSGNNWRLWLLLLVLLMACGGGDDHPSVSDGEDTPDTIIADATFYTVEVRVVVSQASIFERPSRTAPVLYTLVEGDAAQAVGRSIPDAAGTIFFAVEVGEIAGWMVETQVEPQGDIDRLLIIPSVTEDPAAVAVNAAGVPPTPMIGVVARPYGITAPVYALPDLNSEILRLAGETESLQVAFVTNYTFETRFFGVRLESGFGWIDERDFLISGDVNTLAAVALGTPLPTGAVATEVSMQLATPTATVSATFGATLLPTPTTTAGTPANLVTNTPVPATSRPTLAVTLTATPASLRGIDPPPLTIRVPQGWAAAHVNIPIISALDNDAINLSLYEGPLVNAERGYIWLLWRFDPLFDQTGASDDPALSIWSNALLYLRSILFAGCNIGVYPEQRQPYAVGGQTGTGTIFSAVGCGPDAPDVAGWFVALTVGAENYLFYVGITPVENVNVARAELQTVLDSIRFDAVP